MSRDEKTPRCCFHPKQQLVGVCPLCLNERLLVLAAKQGLDQHRHQPRRSKHHGVLRRRYGGGESAHLRGRRSALRFIRVCWRSHDESADQIQGTSLEDSFISIKFEQNGVASWEEKIVSNVPLEKCSNLSTKPATDPNVAEHPKPRSSRWRKRIKQLFKLIRWKRSKKKGYADSAAMRKVP